MEDFKVDDYGSFDNAISTTKTFNTSVTEVKTTATASKEVVSGEAFKGPAADGCATAIDGLNNALTESMSNYKTINKFLKGVSENYQVSDEKAKQYILSAGGMSGFSTPIVSSLEIPENLGQRGYTVTGYGDKGVVYRDMSSVHWDQGTNQRKIFEEWEKQGGKYKNGIAVMNVNGQECYLVATSSDQHQIKERTIFPSSSC